MRDTTKRESESDESANVCLESDMSYHLPKGSSEKLHALLPLVRDSYTHPHKDAITSLDMMQRKEKLFNLTTAILRCT